MIKPFLSVIIFADNDEKEYSPISLLLIDGFLDKTDYSTEIIIIDNGTTSDTSKKLENLKKIIPNLKILRLEKRLRKGEAVRRGMLWANGNLRLFIDLKTPELISEIQKFIPFFKEKYDIVIGSRKSKKPIIINFITRILISKNFPDFYCDFKCLTEEATKKIFSSLKSKGGGFNAEILALAEIFKLKVKNYAINKEPTRQTNKSSTKKGSFQSFFIFVKTISTNFFENLKTLWEVVKIRRELKQAKNKDVSVKMNCF